MAGALPLADKIISKNIRQETRLFIDRILAAWAVVILLCVVILTRLFFLQISNYDYYTTQSQNNRQKLLPVPPDRGLIFDRQGRELANNEVTFTLQITPEQTHDLNRMLKELDGLLALTDNEKDQFLRQQRQRRRFSSVPLRVRLSSDDVAKFSVRRHRFPGAEIVTNMTRHYPHGELTAHVLGYVGRINENELRSIDPNNYSGTQYIGKTGIEKSYEDELHGHVGHKIVEANVRGQIQRELAGSPPTAGSNLHLNLDLALQEYAQQILAGEKSALVALEPATGGVLAMVSTPSFDPNLFITGLDMATYQALQNAPEKPLFNRVIRGRYPPGSTIKPVVGLAGFEYGIRTPKSALYCHGSMQLPGQEHKYRDWKRTGHGHMNFHHAIEQSCDVYFYHLAQDLGIDRLASFLAEFGFGSPTGLDITGEQGGILPSRAWKTKALKQPWFPGETLIVGIGQGYMLTTPMQLAVMTATIANRGKLRQPRLVFAVEKANGNEMNVLPSTHATTIPMRDPSMWDEAVAAMAAVMHGDMGTARKTAMGAPYRMAGKTGTAQVVAIAQDQKYDAKKLEKKHHDHALFVGFAPVDAPRIAVAVIVENGGSGSGTAAPIARKIMDFYLVGPPPPEAAEPVDPPPPSPEE